MFDLFSWSHILILLAVALVVVGPKDLPKLMNTIGKWAGKARSMAAEFKKSFGDMAREAELNELRKEIDNLKAHPGLSDLEAALPDVNQPALKSRSGSVAVDPPLNETAPTPGIVASS